ncbi:hypothetical protein DRZ78_00045 [Candidatus Aerophobetes bacterium]|uniref:Uncharacterized protein n=1 Tax=Aerophobetes bacterium TaxID=2030807 RepID=A0A662D525_UNCAE|nr:MAG: hypothetical protein DRZ78_00045 [Candidatus Aerophobetes bacterium]
MNEKTEKAMLKRRRSEGAHIVYEKYINRQARRTAGKFVINGWGHEAFFHHSIFVSYFLKLLKFFFQALTFLTGKPLRLVSVFSLISQI